MFYRFRLGRPCSCTATGQAHSCPTDSREARATDRFSTVLHRRRCRRAYNDALVKRETRPPSWCVCFLFPSRRRRKTREVTFHASFFPIRCRGRLSGSREQSERQSANEEEEAQAPAFYSRQPTNEHREYRFLPPLSKTPLRPRWRIQPRVHPPFYIRLNNV